MAKKRKLQRILTEERQQSSYTDLILQARLDAVGATSLAPTVTGAVEACAGLWERSFAAAVSDMLDAPMLAMIGRALMLRGEFVAIRLDGVLCAVAHWDIHGRSPSPAGWRYRLDCQTPDGQLTVRASGRDVFHARIGSQPDFPWRGYSPLSRMPETVRLLANMERSLADEQSGPTGHVIPVPTIAAIGTMPSDIAAMKGRVVFGETARAGYGAGEGAAPHGDFRPQRIGPDTKQPTVLLREQVSQVVLAACGVPVELLHRAEGGGAREAWRRFLHGTIAPVGQVVGTEARRALGASGAINFDALFASDLAGRARAYQSLTGSGMDAGLAREICGF